VCVYPGPERRRLLMLALTIAAGQACSHVPRDVLELTDGHVAFMAATADASKEQLQAMKKSAEKRFRDEPTAYHHLRLALVLTAPRSPGPDISAGEQMLKLLTGSGTALGAPERDLARMRMAEVELRLERDGLQRQLNEANEKIRALLKIERSMESERTQGPPGDE